MRSFTALALLLAAAAAPAAAFVPHSGVAFRSASSAAGGGLSLSLSQQPRKQHVGRPLAGLRMVASAEKVEEKVDEEKEMLKGLNMGQKAMLETLNQMSTGQIVSAWRAGEVSTVKAGTATLKRLAGKVTGPISPAKGAVDDSKDGSGSKATFMEGGWEKRGKGSSLFRTIEIYSFCIKIVLREVKLRKVEDKKLKSEMRTEIAKDLKDGLLNLGPTFIKLGQLLSTRIDILAKEYIDELKQLQDDVPGFSGDKAVKVIEEELGKSINLLFDSFDKTPLAAASLGQVHRATLNGKEVVVKVQRTGLLELFKNDLQNLKFAAKVFDKIDPKSDGADRDWVAIYEESAKLLYREISYRQEAAAAIRFQNQFKGVEWIKVPDMYVDYTTDKVLTMEYCPSTKISDVEKIQELGLDRAKLAERSAISYLEQLSNFGFFHCDPHPGNIGVDSGAPGGRLVYYDFGMMDEISGDLKAGLVELILGIYEYDPANKDTTKQVLRAAERMGILDPNADMVPIEKITRFFLEDFANAQSGQRKWTKDKTKEEAKSERAERKSILGESLLSVGNDVPFKFPATFTFVFRAFTSLDGIGKGLDTSYDLTKLTVPYLRKLSELKYGSETKAIAVDWGERTGLNTKDIFNTVKAPRNMAYVTDTLQKMERGDLKVRVRALEAEQRLERLELAQSNTNTIMIAGLLINTGLILSALATGPAPLAARAMVWAGSAGVFKWGLGTMKANAFEKKLVKSNASGKKK